MSSRKSPEKGRPEGPRTLRIPAGRFQQIMIGMLHHLVIDGEPPEPGQTVSLTPHGHENGLPFITVRITAVEPEPLYRISTDEVSEEEYRQPVSVASFALGMGWGKPVWTHGEES